MVVRAASVLATARGSNLPYRVMGLDLALINTGIIVLNETGQVMRRGTLRYPMIKKRSRAYVDTAISEDERIQRLLNIANDIVGFIKQFNVQKVAIEGPTYGTARQAHQHQIGEVAGVVKTQLWLACHIVPWVVPPTTARKHFLGYGMANKENVQAVLSDVGIEYETDHEADAYVVARYLFDSLIDKL